MPHYLPVRTLHSTALLKQRTSLPTSSPTSATLQEATVFSMKMLVASATKGRLTVLGHVAELPHL